MQLKTNLITLWRNYILGRRKISAINGSLTVLGRDLEIEGNFKLKDNLEIYGLMHGDIDMGDSHLFTASGSRVHGNIVANTAEINGEVRGNISCKSTLRLGNTASVKGTIACAELITNAGSNIIGKVKTGSQSELEEDNS